MTEEIKELQPGKEITGEFMINAIDVYKITSEEVNEDWFFSISSKRNRGQQVEGSERKFHVFSYNM